MLHVLINIVNDKQNDVYCCEIILNNIARIHNCFLCLSIIGYTSIINSTFLEKVLQIVVVKLYNDLLTIISQLVNKACNTVKKYSLPVRMIFLQQQVSEN